MCDAGRQRKAHPVGALELGARTACEKCPTVSLTGWVFSFLPPSTAGWEPSESHLPQNRRVPGKAALWS